MIEYNGKQDRDKAYLDYFRIAYCNIKGLPDAKQACLDIENKINDNIIPRPDYTLELQNNGRTVKLTFKSGLQKPYLYKLKYFPTAAFCKIRIK